MKDDIGQPDFPPGGIRPASRAHARVGRPIIGHPYGDIAARAARSGCTILITGETGVGKGHLAQWMHDRSPRRDAAFIPVNCGAIPESLIDSQLFGHARGAFSGATREHPGLVRAADGGTLFLDEVADLPASAQSRLLRLLQEREVQPVGHDRPVLVDVRIVAASNCDLHAAVAERRFREDLLFRLDVISLELAPLRARRDEVLTLLDAFNAEFAAMYGQAPVAFDASARRALRAHGWPGNIRQLRAVVERLHVLAPGEPVDRRRLIEIGQLALEDEAARVRPVVELRADEVRRVLDLNGGSIAETAAAFGVHRSTIYRWIREHGLDPAR